MIPAINRRVVVSTKERAPRRRAMLIPINSETFRAFSRGDETGEDGAREESEFS